MGFIDDHQVKRIKVASTLVNALNASDQDRRIRVTLLEASGIQTDFDVWTQAPDLVRVLFEQFFNVGQDQHTPVPLPNGIQCDLRKHE